MPFSAPAPVPTAVYETYWRFAAERQAVLARRLAGEPPPWTADPVLRAHRFTNAFRVTDRVSQYLVREVQSRPDRSQEPRELFFRTLLFKLFNRVETWEAIEQATGPVAFAGADLDRIAAVLDGLRDRGERVYSAAYIMPPPAFGHRAKHANHLALLAAMMEERMPDRIRQAPSLWAVFEILLRSPGLGPFLAFQFTIDLNYSSLLGFAESEFVVAGPGARDGLAKCFAETGGLSPEELIHWTAERQAAEFARRGLPAPTLSGRSLQPIDVQNLYCEIAKYARVAHPEIRGAAGRTRIKQGFRAHASPLPPLVLPPRWGLPAPRGRADLLTGPGAR